MEKFTFVGFVHKIMQHTFISVEKKRLLCFWYNVGVSTYHMCRMGDGLCKMDIVP